MVAKMMSTVVATSPCLADVRAGAGLYRPLQQLRGRCGTSLRSGLLGLRRGFVRGSEVTRRSLQGGPRADSETEERPVRGEGNGRVGGLEELDNQLQSLTSSDGSMSDAKPPSKENVEKLPRKEAEKVAWPVFGEGFAIYITVGLVLLTIINNILFKVFVGPPVPRSPLFQGREIPQQTPSDGSQQKRYKLRSYKDPKYLQRNAPPPVTDGPVS